jgi:hypothetical protein
MLWSNLIIDPTATTTAVIGDDPVAFTIHEPGRCSSEEKDKNTKDMIIASSVSNEEV